MFIVHIFTFITFILPVLIIRRVCVAHYLVYLYLDVYYLCTIYLAACSPPTHHRHPSQLFYHMFRVCPFLVVLITRIHIQPSTKHCFKSFAFSHPAFPFACCNCRTAILSNELIFLGVVLDSPILQPSLALW